VSTIVGRIVRAAVAVAVIVVTVVWLSGGFEQRVPPGTVEMKSAAAPEGAQQATVEQVTGPLAEWASGALASSRQTVVGSRILARIEEVRVRAGDPVVAGDVLLVLESKDLQARVAQARDALTAARARLDLAQREGKRYDELLQRGVTTRQRYDQAQAELQGAQADVQRLQQAVREAEAALSYTELKAPVSGLVIDRLAEPGETASPGRPLLRIYDPAALRVEVPVRETLAVKLAVGDCLEVAVPAVSETFSGKVEEIVPFAETGARTLLVKVGLPQDPRLFAGLFARVAIPAGTQTRLLVPAAAVERVGQLDFATVIAPSGGLERRMLTLGEYRDDGRVEVLSGLTAGERVSYVPAPGQ